MIFSDNRVTESSTAGLLWNLLAIVCFVNLVTVWIAHLDISAVGLHEGDAVESISTCQS